MPKNRERNSDEFYKAKIRELSKEIRQLRKRIKELEKHQYIPSQDEEMCKTEDDTYPKLDKLKKCPNCGKGNLTTIDIIGRIFENCDVCDYRKKI